MEGGPLLLLGLMGRGIKRENNGTLQKKTRLIKYRSRMSIKKTGLITSKEEENTKWTK